MREGLMEGFNRGLNRIFLIIGGVAALSLMALATGNVLLRIFRLPFSGAYEVISFLGAAVIASALGYTQTSKDHIIVEIFTERYPRKVRLVVDRVASFLMASFFAIVAWRICVWGIKIRESGEVSETLKFAYYPFVFFLAAGFTLAFLSALFNLFHQIPSRGERGR